jgi:hypothetical protein
MLERKLIDVRTFEEIFGYRVRNIVRNQIIVYAKLRHERDYWGRFLALLKRLNVDWQY